MLQALELALPDSKDSFLDGPISCFIKLAASRDCGYSPTQVDMLLVKLVFPFMHGLFTEKFWKAAVQEFATFESINTWEVVDHPPSWERFGHTMSIQD